MRDGAAEAEPRLFVAVEHAHLEPRGALQSRRGSCWRCSPLAPRSWRPRRCAPRRVDGRASPCGRAPRVRRGSKASDSSPVAPSPAARRGAAFISSTTWIDPSGETSATICRIEFEPMSIAATRRCPGASDRRAAFSRTSGRIVDTVARLQIPSRQNAARVAAGLSNISAEPPKRFDELDVRPSTPR